MRKLISLNPTVHGIGVASSFGAPLAGSELAPLALHEKGLLAAIRHNGWAADWEKIGLAEASTAGFSVLLATLAQRTQSALASGQRLLVVGGDHALAAATWKGVGRALGMAPGLLWIDAHLDAHTPASSLSHRLHGMPLAALLGLGEAPLADIDGPCLDPARTVVIGARSYEAAERAHLDGLGVRIYDGEEIAARGLPAVLSEARSRLGELPWGISLDVDVIDPLLAPGVNTPAAGGLAAQELAQALRGCLRERACVGLELAEYNPLTDADGRTAQLLLDLVDALTAPDGATLRRWEAGFGARNYAPLPVVLHAGRGCWLEDVDGRRYLDMMSAYSATSFGHAHPRLLAALAGQAGKLAVTSRAYGNDRLPLLLRRLSMRFGYEAVLPVNTGLEAVEAALKAARKWAYRNKGVPDGRAEIIACDGNFHGRSIAIVGLSGEDQYRDGFGPFPPGLRRVPYGDAEALAAAITPNTAAFLVEPIQGEGGIILPPPGYLRACAELCRRHEVLFIADEIQTGLGRTGSLLACQHEGVRPDAVLLGKALGGGLLPVSAFLADRRVMQVFTPGDHGSTFGGNPLACAVALAALDLLDEEGLAERAARLGAWMLAELRRRIGGLPAVRDLRGRGLLAGIEVDPAIVDARSLAEILMQHGVLSKDTHHTVLRLAPPLVISEEDLAWGIDRISEVFHRLSQRPRLVA